MTSTVSREANSWQEIGEPECTAVFEELIREQLISLNFGNYHPNPHIKAFPARSAQSSVWPLGDLRNGRGPEHYSHKRVADSWPQESQKL